MFFKELGKVIDVRVAGPFCDLTDTHVPVAKQVNGMLQAQVDQVLDGRYLKITLEL